MTTVTTGPEEAIFTRVLEHLLCKSSAFFIVQIGANDGIGTDPVYPFIQRYGDKMSGVFLEPMKDVFAELCHTYRDFPRIKCVNAAIHHAEKTMSLYKVDSARLHELPGWAKGIASFNNAHHTLSGVPKEYIVAETVPCVTFSELCDTYRIDAIDLLQIDTEGYDADIVLRIDFDRIKPTMIRFEHGLPHGIMTIERFEEVVNCLHAVGYKIIPEKHNATAVLMDRVFAKE